MSMYMPDCKETTCSASLRLSNSATNFSNPCESVVRAINRGDITKDMKILEVGSGNLRNSMYILDTFGDVDIYAHEIESTIERFRERYVRFKQLGGQVIENKDDFDDFNVVICTFVLETICPETERIKFLDSLRDALRSNGKLIASFRGYKGVRGNKYKTCPLNEGLITPLRTFVKPYSLSEVKQLLCGSGFSNITFLINYRVNEPENIHLIAES